MKSKIIYLIILSLISYFTIQAKDKIEPDSLKKYTLPSITVNADRAVERQSPAPFSEITKSFIKQNFTLNDIPQLLTELPSIITSSESGNGVGYSDMTMRGFDQRRISVLVNGIPQNDPEDHNVYWIDFPDITESLESIQVQRGAGMTSYGAAAIGGSINLTTSNFINKKGVRVYSGIGWQEYDAGEKKLQPTLNKYLIEGSSGLVENYSFYARLSKINSDGYRDRSFANLNSYFFSGVRFDKNLTTQINVFGGPFSDGLVYNGLPKSFIKDLTKRRMNLTYFSYDSTGNLDNSSLSVRRKQETEQFSQPHFEILNNWQMSENVTFLSSLFYYTGDGYFDYDGSWATADMLRLNAANGYTNAEDPRNSIIRGSVSDKQGGWIPRIVINHESGQLSAGAELRFHHSQHWGNINYAENLPANFDPDFKIYYYEGRRQALSLFARELYNVEKDLTINMEVQFANQLYSIDNEKAGNNYTIYLTQDGRIVGNGGDIFKMNYYFVNPRLGANLNVDKKMNFYGQAAVTSREPVMRSLYPAEDAYFGGAPLFQYDTIPGGIKRYDFSKPNVKPETMYDLEIGCNYKEDNFNINANVYFMEYTDELVKSGRLDIFGNPVEGNAPRTRHIGLELEGSGNLVKNNNFNLIFSANMTLSNNKIVQYDYYIDSQTKISLKDNPIAGFPGFMAHWRLSAAFNDIYISLSQKFVGSFRTDNYGDLLTSNTLLKSSLGSDYYADNNVDSYVVTNLDFSYTLKDILDFRSLRIQMQVNNLFNTLYAARGDGKEFFPGAERSIFLAMELGL